MEDYPVEVEVVSDALTVEAQAIHARHESST